MVEENDRVLSNMMPITPETFNKLLELRHWLKHNQGNVFKISDRHLQHSKLFAQIGSMLAMNVSIGNPGAASAMSQHLVALGYMLAKQDQEDGIDATEDDLPAEAQAMMDDVVASLEAQERDYDRRQAQRDADVA